MNQINKKINRYYDCLLKLGSKLVRIPLNKVNITKNTLFFLSRTPAYFSFTYDSRYFYELKHKVRLFKAVCGIFNFRFHFVFIEICVFCSTNSMGYLTLKRHNSFQN